MKNHKSTTESVKLTYYRKLSSLRLRQFKITNKLLIFNET